MRDLPDDYKAALNASAHGDVALILATLHHPALNPTIRVVSEGRNGVSHYNGRPVNYAFMSNTFLGCPFDVDLLTDDEQPPRSKFSVVDTTRQVGLMFLSLYDSINLELTVLRASDFADLPDDSNTRQPLASPAIIYQAKNLRLRNVQGDALSVQGDVISFDPRSEPWPRYRATQTLLPGLYRK